jgi:hypothetical protein
MRSSSVRQPFKSTCWFSINAPPSARQNARSRSSCSACSASKPPATRMFMATTPLLGCTRASKGTSPLGDMSGRGSRLRLASSSRMSLRDALCASPHCPVDSPVGLKARARSPALGCLGLDAVRADRPAPRAQHLEASESRALRPHGRQHARAWRQDPVREHRLRLSSTAAEMPSPSVAERRLFARRLRHRVRRRYRPFPGSTPDLMHAAPWAGASP